MSCDGLAKRASALLWPGLAAVAVLVSMQPRPATAGTEVKVAVAANFAAPAKTIGAAFEQASGHKLLLSLGATGQLYAQITQGAPFQVFLAADRATPATAVTEGHAVAGTAFTYAVGKLVLYSKSKDLVQGETTLRDAKFNRIAIANPATAPYGAAAVETMKALGVHAALAGRIVQGNNIAQAFQFIDTGNAEVGFVALSQIVLEASGSRWIVPAALHAPIAQDAVLLRTAADNAAAKALLAFLRGPEARRIIKTYGYGVGG